jgi:hypothetical protein
VRARGDQGQVLGLALAFLVFVALLLAATLMGATSQLHATQNFAQQRDDQYAAEASVYGTAQMMRSDLAKGADRGRSSTSCDFVPPSGYVVNGEQASVTCSPQTGSGVGDGNEDDAAPNRPSYSVLALPSDPSSADEGVIDVGGGQVNVFGPVHSNGGQCQLTVGLTQSCDTSPTQDPGTRFPSGYALVPAAAPPSQNAPQCINGQATFQPGTYHAIPDGSCPSLVFQPGPYYFDFTSSSSHIWTVPAGQTVVGGTPGAQPGSCQTEHALGSNGGVLFAFGGDSGMHVAAGASVHLCAEFSSTSQEIAVYGVKADTPGSTQTNDPSPRESADASPNPSDQYMPQRSDATIDQNDQTAQIAAGQTASLDVTRFRSIPPQSIVESASIEIVHGEDPAMQSLTLDVRDGARSIASFSSDPACGTNQLCIGGTDHADTLDVTSAFRDSTTSFYDQSSLSNLNLAFTATAPDAGGPYFSSVDGVVLHLTLAPAAGGYRALTGCTQDLSPAGCRVLSTDPGATLVVDGTVYAPTGIVEVQDTSSQVTFNQGLIARTVLFHSGGSAPFVTAGGGFDRYVILTATVGGTQRVTTSLTFGDVAAYLRGDPTDPSITYNTWDTT